MSEHMFGLGPGHLPKRADKIARKHGAYLVNYDDPRGSGGSGCDSKGRRHWFCCRNQGAPFDDSTARAVIADLVEAGLIDQSR